MNDELLPFLLGFLTPVLFVTFLLNLFFVLDKRSEKPDYSCKMQTLLEYFPTNWISCELTKPRFNGDTK